MRQVRVMIVDDAPEVREALGTLLPLAGAAAGLAVEVVGEAGDGLGAVERVAALAPDVVLMDLEMPEMDGFTATRAVKAVCPLTRVVVLSVHSDPVSRDLSRDAGADAFVEKGLGITDLLESIAGSPPEEAEGGTT